MEPAAKDLLQLGFSFFVAGYLLVWGHRATLEIRHLVAAQSARLVVMEQVLVELKSLLARCVDRGSPS